MQFSLANSLPNIGQFHYSKNRNRAIAFQQRGI